MGIKRYVLLSIVYMLAIGLYVYSFNGDKYTLDLYALSVNLPIAIWIVVPTFILFLASISHLAFYSFKDFFYNRALQKDYDTFINVSKSRIIGEESNLKFKTKWFKTPGQVIKIFGYMKKADIQNLENEELKQYCQLVDDIQNGKYEDIKKYKLSSENELFIQNEKNKLKDEPKYCYSILKNCKNLDSKLCKLAYNELVSIGTFSEIKKYDFHIDKAIFRRMMERYLDEEDDFDIDINSIEKMLEQFNANSEDYLELAQEIKVKLDPDALIKLFRKLYNEKGQLAANAYLYTLYELQMIDKVREILDNSDEDEFLKFKTLLFLRDHGKTIDTVKFLKV
ncbi:MAG: fatty-acid--CoA ligase [Epsilonproteobacteria bacterium]|nr:fatty-acid--CoA ligase [Campylobacterota bacterium]